MIRTKKEVSMTEEEYIQYELQSLVRHEYINGQLIEMPGESSFNNSIALNLAAIAKIQLKGSGYRAYAHDVKLKVPDDPNYFYPDLFLTNEERGSDVFVMRKAVLIVEVLSESTRTYDMVDKYIQYRKIPELQYYMLIEPVKKIVTLSFKNEQGEWETDFFSGMEEEIILPKINLRFPISDLYE